MKECDLYPPIKRFLQGCGYEVKSEVADCDILACRDDVYIAVEMKTALGIRLLSQGVKRQELYDLVYIAFPKPKSTRRINRHFSDTKKMIKRLGLGLLLVDLRGEGRCIEEFPPMDVDLIRVRNAKRAKRKKAIAQFQALSGDNNIGGTTRTKKMTAYKESALLIALYLKRDGPNSAKILRKFECPDNTYDILYMNHYSWFKRIDKGIYNLTSNGEKALVEYEEICNILKKLMTYEQIEN